MWGNFHDESKNGSPCLAPKERKTFIPMPCKTAIAVERRIFCSNLLHHPGTWLSYPNEGKRACHSARNSLNRLMAHCSHRRIVCRLGRKSLAIYEVLYPPKRAFKQCSCSSQRYQRLGAMHSGRAEQVWRQNWQKNLKTGMGFRLACFRRSALR